jgi:hypothetical protein
MNLHSPYRYWMKIYFLFSSLISSIKGFWDEFLGLKPLKFDLLSLFIFFVNDGEFLIVTEFCGWPSIQTSIAVLQIAHEFLVFNFSSALLIDFLFDSS